jgi:hypothetical protein
MSALTYERLATAPGPRAPARGRAAREAGATYTVAVPGDSAEALRRVLDAINRIGLGAASALLDRATEESLSQDRLDRFLEDWLGGSRTSAAASTRAQQALWNAQRRLAVLEEWGTLTSHQVADVAGSSARNRSALAHAWRQQGRVFAVAHGDELLYPTFQFGPDGRPRPAIGRVLAVLGDRLGGWGTAVWFTSPNPHLGGARPVDRLDDVAALEEAAGAVVSPVEF